MEEVPTKEQLELTMQPESCSPNINIINFACVFFFFPHGDFPPHIVAVFLVIDTVCHGYSVSLCCLPPSALLTPLIYRPIKQYLPA